MVKRKRNEMMYGVNCWQGLGKIKNITDKGSSMKQISWIKLGGVVGGCLIGSWLLLASAQAASFDCSKAQAKAEHLICDNPEISKLDEELSSSYKAAVQDKAQAEAITQAQRQWIKERNGCIDAACVKYAYKKRLLSLRPIVSIPITATADANYSDYELDLKTRNYSGRADLEGEPFESSQDPEVCALYLQNLRYFAKNNLPMSCGQPVAPILAGKIKPVEWENLDPEKYPELFKAVVFKVFPPRSYEDRSYPSEKDLSHWRESIRNGGVVFRRAKLELKGNMALPPLNMPIEKSYQIVQFGFDVTDPANPNSRLRCEQNAGRVMPNIRRNDLGLFIASENLREFYEELYDLHLGYQSYFNLWLINGQPYGEQYDDKGNVLLSELRSDYVHLERVCLFQYKKER
jgi:uncharacterized protein